MLIRIIPLLLLLSFINAQIALPTFHAVHKPHTAEASSLYDFTTHTFTNCGATGRNGPTLANCKSSYDVSWEDDTDYFNVQTQGIQEWTVPITGTYTIEVWGARGGHSTRGAGAGARMRGDFVLTVNTVVSIVIGQMGGNESGNTNRSGGGGGGSFCYVGSTLKIAAAGGAGHIGYSNGSYNRSTSDGNSGTSGSDGSGWSQGSGGDGGTGGSGGDGTSYGGAGAGWSSDGGDATNYSGDQGGSSKAGNWIGGLNSTYGGLGGFGGGGGGGHAYGGGGGGGGYSGGGAGTDPGSGGGGGSYNSGSSQSNTAGVREDHGQVIITKN